MRQLFIFLIVSIGCFLNLPLFSQESVDNASITPVESPAHPKPVRIAGTTDSLKKAQLFLDKKQYQSALKIALNALDNATEQDDKKLIYNSNRLIAQIFEKSNNYEKALEYYLINVKFLENGQDVKTKAVLFLNISAMHFQLQAMDSTEVYLTKVIQLKNDTKAIEILKAKAYSNLSALQVEFSATHLGINRLGSAEINAKKALSIYKKHGELKSMVYSLNSLGSVYMLQHKYNQAKKVFLEALEIIENHADVSDKNLREVLYDNLSYVLFQLKDYNAYIYQEKSINIRDSIRDSEVSGILAEIEGKYNTETIKKESELKSARENAKLKHTQDINIILTVISISLFIGAWLVYRYLKLRQEKLQLELIQNQLIQQHELEQIQNETKEKILNATIDGKESERKMIAETLHHSVSSLLSAASLHLQASKMIMKGKQPAEIQKAHKIILEASDKIRNLSHSLVSSVLLKFGLRFALQDLCEKYSNSALTFRCDCEELKRFAPEFELKINSIIDELLNNVIKHSKATQTKIALSEKNGFLEIQIKDNGKGFNPKDIGVNSGLGLMQIEARIKQMKGIFTIDSDGTNGTKIFILVPVQVLQNGHSGN